VSAPVVARGHTGEIAQIVKAGEACSGKVDSTGRLERGQEKPTPRYLEN